MVPRAATAPGLPRLVRDEPPGDVQASRPERSSLSLRHAASFLTLVEEGSVTRAAARLGIGQSTLSSHVKALEGELDRQLAERVQGGLAVTAAGWRAYARLRPLLTGAAFALRRFRHNSGQPSHFVTVGLPSGFPGTPIDAGFGAMAAAMAVRAPDTCFLVGTGDGAPLPQGIGLEYDASGEGIADGWLLLEPAGEAPSSTRPEPWSGLRGREVLLPFLSDGLAELAREAIRQAGGQVVPVAMEPAALLATARQRPGFCALLPRGLVNLAATPALEARPMAAGPRDPMLRIDATGMPEVAPLLKECLHKALLEARRGQAPSLTGPGEMISLKHSRSFLVLFEERHVGRAARRLFVVQPALTMQLHQIEQQLGCPLFERTGRGMVPTPAAVRLQTHLKSLVGDIDAAAAALRQSPAPAVRGVQIGLIPSLDDDSVMTEGFVQALARWQKQHPEVQAQVVEGFSDELVHWLRTRRLDLAIVDRRLNEALLLVEPIAEDPMAVVADGARRLLPPGPVTLRSLSRLQLVLPSDRHGLRTLISRHLAAHGVSLQPSLEVDSLAVALRLVRSGPYATILPVGAVQKSAARRRLALHEIEAPRLVREICLVQSRAVPARQPVLALIQELRTAFSAQKPVTS